MSVNEELLIEIQELTKKRNTLLEQVKYAEQLEQVAWDSYNALTEHIKALDKKEKINKLYWANSQSEIQIQSDLVLSSFDKLKKLLTQLNDDEANNLLNLFEQELEELFENLGIEK